MTTRERFTRMFQHREADRVPISDGPWGATIERWQSEGMPEDVDWVDYLDLDREGWVSVDNSPRYEERVLEETDEYIVKTTRWGATLKDWKHAASAPEFLDFTIKDPDSWEDAKARMTPSDDRMDWDFLKANYPKWRDEGRWITGHFWFGFDVTHSWTVGTERLLMALVENPEWCVDMFNHFLDLDIALFDRLWDAGYTFDCIQWPDDMGYKYHQFFSLSTYRDLLKPVHKRAIDWAHSKGIYAELHSCGDINPIVPELLDIGLDGLNPLEVKAGMNPRELKKQYGDKLLFHGGVNAVLWDHPDELEAEMRDIIPIMKENGGYIFASDHSIPSTVSLEGIKRIMSLAKELGSY